MCEWLLQKMQCAFPNRIHHFFVSAGTTDKNDGDAIAPLNQFCLHIPPGHFRHLVIQNQTTNLTYLFMGQEFFAFPLNEVQEIVKIRKIQNFSPDPDTDFHYVIFNSCKL